MKVISIKEQLLVLELLYVNLSKHLSIDDILNKLNKNKSESVDIKSKLDAMMSSGIVGYKFVNNKLSYSLTDFGIYFYKKMQAEQANYLTNEVSQ